MMELAGRRTLIDPIDLIDWHSGKLLREVITTGEGDAATTQILDFFYDNNGTPFALKTNDIVYYYVTNLQGDVIQLVDSTGTAVAAYEYDPFGNIVSQTGDLADLNPLRYRGYYYDKETGLYYLQSRYYDPKIGRFINADSYASTGQGLVGHNMFAYCRNNPVCRIDVSGTADANAYNNDGEVMSSDEWEDRDGGGGFWDSFVQSMQDAANGLNMAMGGRHFTSSERHHVLSNKHKTYTPQYKEVTDRYNMELSMKENIVELQGHSGRHTNAYHNFMLSSLNNLDAIANGNIPRFNEGFLLIVDFLKNNPGLPYAR